MEPYQASKASGLDDRTFPIVLGRVRCSCAYEMPVSRHTAARPKASFSTVLSVLISGWSCVLNKLTGRAVSITRYALFSD